jgi:hypothetical protein
MWIRELARCECLSHRGSHRNRNRDLECDLNCGCDVIVNLDARGI